MQTAKEKFKWLWENLEKILIILFFLTFTLNIRKVFLTPYSFLRGGFNEFTTLSLSWADVLMIAIIFIYTIKYLYGQYSAAFKPNSVIYNNKKSLSTYNSQSISRETFFLLLFISWTGLSILWSQYKPISAFRFLSFTEIAIFAYISLNSLKSSKWLKIAFFALILNGLFQSLLGIAQFMENKSLGLHFLGESIIGPNVDGVAKIIINGQKHIRSYGTFPHPNIMAGFLIIPLLILASEYILRLKKVSHETLLDFMPMRLLYVAGAVTALSFVLTFSRSAFLGLFVGFIIMPIVTLHTELPKRVQASKRSIPVLIGILLLAIGLAIFISKHSFFSNQSLQERNLYQIVSYETILNHPERGIGIGQFVLNEYKIHPYLENWQYQPVHNIYLLIFSELGFVGLILFLLFLISLFWKLLNNLKGEFVFTLLLFYCIIFSFLILSLFDHYFWDIKIGTIIFVLPFMFSKNLPTYRQAKK